MSEKCWYMDANTDDMLPPAEPPCKQRKKNILIRGWHSRERVLRRCRFYCAVKTAVHSQFLLHISLSLCALDFMSHNINVNVISFKGRTSKWKHRNAAKVRNRIVTFTLVTLMFLSLKNWKTSLCSSTRIVWMECTLQLLENYELSIHF